MGLPDRLDRSNMPPGHIGPAVGTGGGAGAALAAPSVPSPSQNGLNGPDRNLVLKFDRLLRRSRARTWRRCRRLLCVAGGRVYRTCRGHRWRRRRSAGSSECPVSISERLERPTAWVTGADCLIGTWCSNLTGCCGVRERGRGAGAGGCCDADAADASSQRCSFKTAVAATYSSAGARSSSRKVAAADCLIGTWCSNLTGCCGVRERGRGAGAGGCCALPWAPVAAPAQRWQLRVSRLHLRTA
jgi:hypothetical protein